MKIQPRVSKCKLEEAFALSPVPIFVRNFKKWKKEHVELLKDWDAKAYAIYVDCIKSAAEELKISEKCIILSSGNPNWKNILFVFHEIKHAIDGFNDKELCNQGIVDVSVDNEASAQLYAIRQLVRMQLWKVAWRAIGQVNGWLKNDNSDVYHQAAIKLHKSDEFKQFKKQIELKIKNPLTTISHDERGN